MMKRGRDFLLDALSVCVCGTYMMDRVLPIEYSLLKEMSRAWMVTRIARELETERKVTITVSEQIGEIKHD